MVSEHLLAPTPSSSHHWSGSGVLPRPPLLLCHLQASGSAGHPHQTGGWRPGHQTPLEASCALQQGLVWMWDVLHLAPSGLPAVLSCRILTGSARPHLLPTPGLASSVYVGGWGWGRPLFSQGSWDGGGALSFLLFIALGLWGGFPWPPPPPQGRGRSPGESQAWGGSLRVRRGGRSPVTKVPGPGPTAGIRDPLSNVTPERSPWLL